MLGGLEDRAYQRGVQLDVIRPGKPVENAHIESLNGRLRDECLNGQQFVSLAGDQKRLPRDPYEATAKWVRATIEEGLASKYGAAGPCS